MKKPTTIEEKGLKGENMENPKTYNGFKVEDTVTIVKDFEESEKNDLCIGDKAEIVRFEPSPHFTYVAVLVSGNASYCFPATTDYLSKEGRVNSEPSKSQDDIRSELWNVLVG